jgi:hypothetical protein
MTRCTIATIHHYSPLRYLYQYEYHNDTKVAILSEVKADAGSSSERAVHTNPLARISIAACSFAVGWRGGPSRSSRARICSKSHAVVVIFAHAMLARHALASEDIIHPGAPDEVVKDLLILGRLGDKVIAIDAGGREAGDSATGGEILLDEFFISLHAGTML